MFIYSLKASTLKFFGIVGVALATLAILIIVVPTLSSQTTWEISAMNQSISFENVDDSEDGARFLAQYGWTVEETPVEECEITIPKDFDKVMTQYNEIQKQQGLNLEKYAKKTAKRFTYKITNYPSYEGTVYANIIVYKDKVIAGDICTADARGFIHTLQMPVKQDS